MFFFGILFDISLIALLLVVIVALVVILSFNTLVSRRNRVANAWAQIDVQLKRRYDLIPKLVDTVKGYMTYEKNLLKDITTLRSSIVAGSVQDKASANNQLSQTLKTLFAVAEKYPDLKAGKEFQELQHEIEVTEDTIAFVRTSYNDYVLDYNNALQMFPTNIFAQLFKFQKADFFKTTEEEKKDVDVNFKDVNNNNNINSNSNNSNNSNNNNNMQSNQSNKNLKKNDQNTKDNTKPKTKQSK